MLKNIPFYSSLVKQPMFDNIKSTQTDVLIYGAIEVHAMGHLGCIASNDLISREVGLSVGTIANGISKLNKAGWVKVIMDNNNHRVSIEPLLEITTPMSKTLHATMNPPSLQNEPPLHATMNIEYISKVQLKDNISSGKSKSAKPIHEEAIKIAKSLNSQLKSRYDYTPTADKVIESWSKDIEKINRLDGVDYKIVWNVMNWSQKDSFWESNIKSGKTLRDKMVTLRMRMDKESKQPVPNKSYTNMKTFVAPKDNRSKSTDSEAYKKFQENKKKLLKGL